MLHPLQAAQLASEHRAALQDKAARRRSERPVRGELSATGVIDRLTAMAGELGRSAHFRAARAILGSAGSRGR